MASTYRWIASIVVLALLTAACSVGATEGSSRSEEVRLYVLAAASLTDAFREIQTRYEAAHPGVRLVPTFASTGRLKQQIERGAPADLFLSAGAEEMEELVRKNLIDSRFQTDLLQNDLVLIGPKGSDLQGLGDLASHRVKRIAIGHPETVPAGTYAEEALKRVGLWENWSESSFLRLMSGRCWPMWRRAMRMRASCIGRIADSPGTFRFWRRSLPTAIARLCIRWVL